MVSAASRAKDEPPKRALASFAFFNTSDDLRGLYAARVANCSLLIDSGAFTAWSIGQPVDLSRYIEWCKAISGVVDAYLTLDVVMNEDASLANLATMRRAGLDPMPVLVTTMKTKACVDMVRECKGQPAIAVAGGTRKGGATEEWFVRRCAEVRRYLGASAWIHGLGYSKSVDGMIRCAADSFDSSTHANPRRFGVAVGFDPRNGTTMMVSAGAGRDGGRLNDAEVRRCTDMSMTADDLGTKAMGKRYGRSSLAALTAMEQSARRLAVHGKRLYLALNSRKDLSRFTGGYIGK